MNNHLDAIRIVIADEHPIRRHSLRRLLESQPGIQILDEASDPSAAVRLTRYFKPDILLLDFALSQGLEAQVRIDFVNHLSPTRTVLMVNAIERFHILEAFRLGAQGILLRTSAVQQLLKDMGSVMSGNYWLESGRASILLEALRERLSKGNGVAAPKDYKLTRRELDIIRKVATGHSNKEVGETFSISERTVKHHLTNIFSKVGVSSRLQLALFAVNYQLKTSEVSSLAAQPIESEQEN